jgi:hypothetical protein
MINNGDGLGFEELAGNRKKSKQEIEAWVSEKSKSLGGIYYREGYSMKFKHQETEFKWLWIKNNLPVTGVDLK